MYKKSLLALIALLLVLSSASSALALDAVDISGYSRTAGYEYVTFGAYPTDADGTVRPIVWRVMKNENGEAYLLSEYILFGAPVHGDYEHYSGWESSDLYAYLNSVFLNDAFSGEEQAALLVRTEDNALVTLITSDEMKDASIGFSSNSARLCESTAWAKILPDPPIFELPSTNNKGKWKPLYVYSKGKKYSPWWSRTRSSDYPHEQRRVMDEGKIGRISTGNSDLGVRPAIHVDLSLLRIQGGGGTLESPYQLVSLATAAMEATPVTAEPTAAPVETAVTEAAEPTQPTEAPIPAEPEPTEQPAAKQGFTAAADPAGIHELFPELTDQGFLPEGESEFVYQDDKAGLWLYASQTLRIEINRRTGTNHKKEPLRWYEAHIYTRDAGEFFDLYPYDEEHYTSYGDRYKALADKIAAQHHLVFGINSDYFIYRVERAREEKQKNPNNTYPIGVEVRNGNIMFESPRPRKKDGSESEVYPPLDAMALYPDGTITLHRNAEFTDKQITAAQLIENGATDVLSFGPILVENGEVSPRSKEFGNTPNPRTAFGMVEQGHYIAVMVESRIAESKGESCVWLGEKMAELGCYSAINLDGGATSTMIFMGKQINKSGNYGDITNRTQNELLGIGHSDAVQ